MTNVIARSLHKGGKRAKEGQDNVIREVAIGMTSL